ncbi:hypothetical protein TrRE_jg5373 [Triparma retinervis]|uniref:Mitochondrial carrier protein n=1 Tax=Triparma retinervis TaxID=2557542 RepID=A0A9W7FUG9_9STRA|nr:hypothetical protein TrRE_jg5373 [Triparma retinervis]
MSPSNPSSQPSNPITSQTINVNIQQSLSRGLTGAIGSIPGTILAHPFDVTKIILQSGLASNFRNSLPLALKGPTGPYRGLTAGIKQKFITRGPMFLLSDFFTQTLHVKTPLTLDQSVFFGSVLSGYSTGALASLSEWSKVQSAVLPLSPSPLSPPPRPSTALSLLSRSLKSGRLPMLCSRVHAAGTRNAIFDCTFFTISSRLNAEHRASQAGAYAKAAVAAVVVDYLFDAACKRMMSVGPGGEVGGVWGEVWGLVGREGIRGAYRGVGVKAAEFAVSYGATGMVAMKARKVWGGEEG